MAELWVNPGIETLELSEGLRRILHEALGLLFEVWTPKTLRPSAVPPVAPERSSLLGRGSAQALALARPSAGGVSCSV